jgi:hypothetical protein
MAAAKATSAYSIELQWRMWRTGDIGYFVLSERGVAAGGASSGDRRVLRGGGGGDAAPPERSPARCAQVLPKRQARRRAAENLRRSARPPCSGSW